MKHPETHDWMSWLYGESTPAEKRILDAHLTACPECRDRVERWRATLGHLDSAAAPRLDPVRRRNYWPALKWSAAAAVLLSVGVGMGRLSGATERALDQRLQTWSSSWQAHAEDQRRRDLDEMAARTMASVRTENQEILAELSRRIQAMREEDRVALVQLIERVDRQRAGEIGELRDGLAALASQTGDGLERAQTQMRLLAGTLEGTFSNPNPKSQEIP
jgi:hypothetical protein